MIDNPNVLDAVGINEETQAIELHINDNLDFSNEEEHLKMLQNKLESYLAYVQNGGLEEIFQEDAYARRVYFVINFSYEPHINTKEFLEYIRLNLEMNNINLGWLVKPQS